MSRKRVPSCRPTTYVAADIGHCPLEACATVCRCHWFVAYTKALLSSLSAFIRIEIIRVFDVSVAAFNSQERLVQRPRPYGAVRRTRLWCFVRKSY